MSTRYDLVTSACGHCGRGDEPIEISTSLTMWRGVFVRPDLALPPTPQITSVTQWLDRLTQLESTASASIVDEYGHFWRVDELRERVLAVPAERRRRQYDWRLDHPMDSIPLAIEPRGYWLDDRGFTFVGGTALPRPL